MSLNNLRIFRAGALSVAEDMAAGDMLPGVTSPTLVVGRQFTGAATFTLIFNAPDGELPWHFPLSIDDDEDVVRHKLLDGLPRYFAARKNNAALFHKIEKEVRVTLADRGSTLAIGLKGVETAPRRIALPGLGLFIQAHGADAKTQHLHLTLKHSYELRTIVNQIAERHEKAIVVAERWAAQGWTGDVEEVAYSVMVDNDLMLSDIVADLEWRERVRFRASNGRYQGSFYWHGFAVSVEIVPPERKWMFGDGMLTAPDTRVPITLQGAASGRQLRELIDVQILPAQAVMTKITVSHDDILQVTLLRRLPFDTAWRVGQP